MLGELTAGMSLAFQQAPPARGAFRCTVGGAKSGAKLVV